jgi:hypothetical protein
MVAVGENDFEADEITGVAHRFVLPDLRPGRMPSRFQGMAQAGRRSGMEGVGGWKVARQGGRGTAPATVRVRFFASSLQSWTSCCEPSRTSGLRVFGS